MTQPVSPRELEVYLDEVFGYNSFRPGQYEAVERVLQDKSTLVVQSTASGKSLCYQLPAAVLTGKYRCMVVLISPLVSLMQDQIERLPRRLKGGSLNSSMTKVQRSKMYEEILDNKIKVLFLSPETLVSPYFLYLARDPRMPPVPFACIDEAHCVSEWSHNFRPSYLRLARVLKESLGLRCLLGLTATATRTTESSVAQQLGVGPEGIIRGAPVPQNLQLAASSPAVRREELVHLLLHHHRYRTGPAIVYCTQQAETERVSSFLRTNQLDARCYHAGMRSAERRKVGPRFACCVC